MPVQSAPDPVSVADVRGRVNAEDDGPIGPGTLVLTKCLALAQVKVAAHTADYDTDALADSSVPPIPQAVRDEAVVAVAAELFSQQKAPNGVLNQQYGSEDGNANVPIRISADPLRPAYPLLGQWVSPVTFA